MMHVIRKGGVCAGVVSFNPSIERITENVSAIASQVARVYVFDNGSANSEELRKALSAVPIVEFIEHPGNSGIAYALNRICERAEEEGFSYVVTLDQDSVATPGMVRELISHAAKDVGVVAPQIVDRNKDGAEGWETRLDHRIFDFREAARKGVITSGCLTNLHAFRFVGGFDELFFIDYVDYDFNKRLLIEGFRIVRTGNTALIHECGRFTPTWLWTPRKGQDGRWRMERFYSFGHSAFRCYYKARNRILYSKKYGPTGNIKGFEGARQLLPQVILTILFETNKLEKLSSFVAGIRDGLGLRVEPYAIHRNNSEASGK